MGLIEVPFRKKDAEVFCHNQFKQFFLAAEIIIQQGEVDSGFFGYVSYTGCIQSFLEKQFPGCFLDFRFSINGL